MADDNDYLLDEMMISRERKMPLHAQVESALRRALEEHFEDGQTFWTEALLMERLGISRATVRQALAELSRDGLLVRQAAKGSVVTKPAEDITLGIFFHRYNSDFFSEMLELFAAECLKRGLRLEPFNTYGGARLTDTFEGITLPPHRLRVVLLGQSSEVTLQLYEALSERGYRTVTVDTVLSFPGASVTTDNAQLMQVGVDHLMGLGHERIVLLANEPEVAGSVQLRMQAFRNLCKSYGLTDSKVYSCGTRYGDSSFDAAYNAMDQVWAMRPTAVFTLSDPGAWAVLKWCAERGIATPQELSVLGLEGVRPSRFVHPTLTTVAHPMAELARRAVEMLWEDEVKQEQLLPHLILGASTGPCPSNAGQHEAILSGSVSTVDSHAGREA